jgi:hypothetical protein
MQGMCRLVAGMIFVFTSTVRGGMGWNASTDPMAKKGKGGQEKKITRHIHLELSQILICVKYSSPRVAADLTSYLLAPTIEEGKCVRKCQSVVG